MQAKSSRRCSNEAANQSRGVRSRIRASVLCAIVTVGVQEPERVLGFRIEGGQLIARVATGGCTVPDDFKVLVKRSQFDARNLQLTLVRVRQDMCKGFFPEGVEVVFDLSLLGVSPSAKIEMMNPW